MVAEPADRRHEWKRSKVSEFKHRTAAAAATDPVDLSTDMVTTTDFASFQQQLRQDMADVIQRLRVEVTGATNGRTDMLNSIKTALQNVTVWPADSKPISNQRLYSKELGRQQPKRRISKLHVRLAGVGASVVEPRRHVPYQCGERTKFGSSTIAVDYPEAKFRFVEASLYQVLHRATANEARRIVQQRKGRKGFGAWHAIVRRFDQRTMSGTNQHIQR